MKDISNNTNKKEMASQFDYPLEDRRKILAKEITGLSQEVTRLRKINRGWDSGLTIATIVLTLAITTLSNSNQVDQQAKEITISILGGVVVAIQSIGNSFPVKQRAGSYRLLQAQANNLLSDISYVEDENELKLLETQFYQLRSETAKVEVNTN